MESLLQKAPHNVRTGEVYDGILSEYKGVKNERSNYVHGLWFTNIATGKVYLKIKDEHGFAFLTPRKSP